eukprot:gene3793-4051_t
MQCLGDRDQLFADSAAEVLTDVVFDELIEVRLASLACLLSWAQRAQDQQDIKQPPRSDTGVTLQMPQDLREQRKQHHLPEQQLQIDAADVEMVDAPPGPAEAGARSRQLRKLGLPSWAPDGLTAAAAALHDKDSRVRLLALQLLRLLLPANTHGLMRMLLGLTACCERYRQQAEVRTVMQLVELTGQQRAEVVGRSLRQLVQQLSQASVAAVAPGLAAHDGRNTKTHQHAACDGDVAQQWAEGASVVGQGVDEGPGDVKIQVVTQLLHAAALARPQMLPSLQMYLEKAQLLQHPWMGPLRLLVGGHGQ